MTNRFLESSKFSIFIFSLFLLSDANANSNDSSAIEYKTETMNICESRNKSLISRPTEGQIFSPEYPNGLPYHEIFCHHDFSFSPNLNLVFDFEEIFLGDDSRRSGRPCHDQDHIHVLSVRNGTYQSLGFYCASRKDWDRCLKVPPGSSWVQIQFYARNKSTPQFGAAEIPNRFSFKIGFKVDNDTACPQRFVLTELIVWASGTVFVVVVFLVVPFVVVTCKQRCSKKNKDPKKQILSPSNAVLESDAYAHGVGYDPSRPTLFPTAPDDRPAAPFDSPPDTPPDTPPASTPIFLPVNDSPFSLPAAVYPTPSGRRRIVQSELTDEKNLPIFFTNLANRKPERPATTVTPTLANGDGFPDVVGADKRAVSLGEREMSSRSGDKEGINRQKNNHPTARPVTSASNDIEYADPSYVFHNQPYPKHKRDSFLFSQGGSSPGIYTQPSFPVTSPKRHPSIQETPSEYIARRPEGEYSVPWDETRDNLDSLMPDLIQSQNPRHRDASVSSNWHSVAPGSKTDLVANKSASRPSTEPTTKASKKSKDKKEKKEEEKKKKKLRRSKEDKLDEINKREENQNKGEDGKTRMDENGRAIGGGTDDIDDSERRPSVLGAEPDLEFQSISENIFMKKNQVVKRPGTQISS